MSTLQVELRNFGKETLTLTLKWSVALLPLLSYYTM